MTPVSFVEGYRNYTMFADGISCMPPHPACSGIRKSLFLILNDVGDFLEGVANLFNY